MRKPVLPVEVITAVQRHNIIDADRIILFSFQQEQVAFEKAQHLADIINTLSEPVAIGTLSPQPVHIPVLASGIAVTDSDGNEFVLPAENLEAELVVKHREPKEGEK